AIPFETYKLALTKKLLDTVFGTKLNDVVDTTTARSLLGNSKISGYLTAPDPLKRFDPNTLDGQYWICSGVAGFNADAAKHFYLPERYTDPFGNTTTLDYDS